MKVYVVLEVYSCVEAYAEEIIDIYSYEDNADKVCEEFNSKRKPHTHYEYRCVSYEVK